MYFNYSYQYSIFIVNPVYTLSLFVSNEYMHMAFIRVPEMASFWIWNILVTDARWGNLALKWKPYAFYGTTQTYNVLYFIISRIPNRTQQI